MFTFFEIVKLVFFLWGLHFCFLLPLTLDYLENLICCVFGLNILYFSKLSDKFTKMFEPTFSIDNFWLWQYKNTYNTNIAQFFFANDTNILQWFYVNWTIACSFFICFISFWLFLTAVSFRYKLYYFVLCIFSFSIVGYTVSFDGLTMLMLVTEVTVFTLILFIFLTQKFETSHHTVNGSLKFFYFTSLLIIFVLVRNSVYTAYVYYANIFPYVQDIVAHDLISLFMFVLELTPAVTFYISVILGVFSIFFITFFFTLKNLKKLKASKQEELNTIRKQILARQAVYKTRIRTYQNKSTKKPEKTKETEKKKPKTRPTVLKVNRKRNIAYRVVINKHVPKRKF